MGNAVAFNFRPAIRERIPLVIVLAGPSGSGKTKSALELATGLAQGGKIGAIDTEAGRMLHYADDYKFEHGELRPPFRPAAYSDAIAAANAAGYAVTIIDSGSHEHNGPGGILDWHEEELTRMAGDDWQKSERMKMAAWIRPKLAHKQFVARMLQSRSHLIVCLRAEPKVAMQKNGNKTEIVDLGFQPICDSQFMYEATVSLMMLPDKPGTFTPIKLQGQHKPMLPEGSYIDRAAGERLAVWAAGGAAPKQEDLADRAVSAARLGTDHFRAWWKELAKEQREQLKPKLAEYQRKAEDADAINGDPLDEREPPAPDNDDPLGPDPRAAA